MPKYTLILWYTTAELIILFIFNFLSMMKGKMCAAHWVAFILVFAGALNWGLVGAFDFNLVHAIFGSIMWLERLVYILVGLAGILMLFTGKCKKCMDCCANCAPKMEQKKM